MSITVLLITSGHRTISGQNFILSIHFGYGRKKMSKRSSSESLSSEKASDTSSSLFQCPLSTKKRAVTTKTVDRWILDYNKTLNTATWLNYDKADHYHVSRLKCTVCTKFVDTIRGSRNFSSGFIEDSINLRTSSFKEHAKSDMQERGMLLLKHEQSTNVCDYAPIARVLCRIEEVAEAKIRRKFDIAYLRYTHTVHTCTLYM